MLDLYHPEDGGARSFETSLTIYELTWQHITDDLKFQCVSFPHAVCCWSWNQNINEYLINYIEGKSNMKNISWIMSENAATATTFFIVYNGVNFVRRL